MQTLDDVLPGYARDYDRRRDTELPLRDYLEACRSDASLFAPAPERIVGFFRHAATA